MGKHDVAYKDFFSVRENVADLLRDFINEEWVSLLDFTSLELYPSEHITQDSSLRYDDIIWRLKWGDNKWLYLYIIIEFQKKIDYFMNVRIMSYVALLYESLLKQDKEMRRKRKLPAILPMVYYTGQKPWNAKQDIYDSIELPHQSMGKYLPHLKYYLIDEVNGIDEGLLKTINSFVKAIMRISRSKNTAELSEALLNIKHAFRSSKNKKDIKVLLTWIRRYVMASRPDEFIPELNSLQEAYDMTLNFSKMDREEGKKEGIIEGEIKGKLEGIVEGEIKGKLEAIKFMIKNLLKQKLPIEVIWKATELPRSEFDELLLEINN